MMKQLIVLIAVIALAAGLVYAGGSISDMHDRLLVKFMVRAGVSDSTIDYVLTLPDISKIEIVGDKISDGDFRWISEEFDEVAIIMFKNGFYKVNVLLDFSEVNKR